VNGPRASESLFETLALAILRGRLAAGSSLPSERSLSEEHGVSRITVRQAIHKLSDARLARVHQGAPTIVLDHEASLDPRVLALRYRLQGPAERREMGERRMVQGLSIVFLASLRASPEALAELARAVEEFAERGSPEAELPALEERFWTGLATLTNNRPIAREVAWWFREGYGARGDDTGGVPGASRVPFYRELLRRLRDRDRPAAYYLDILAVLLPA
jgi:GntR family transcriptional regulator, transcriptional repressor for pyruvate dehydrogenase complex